MAKKKTHEEYVAEVKQINPNIEVVGIYVNAKTPIDHFCLTHNIKWIARPDNILQGKGCPECAKDARRMAIAMTHEEYVKKLKEILPHIRVVDDYINIVTKITHYCEKHNIYWDVAPQTLLYGGCGCTQCSKESVVSSKTKTRDVYIDELAVKNPNISLVGEYLGCKTKTQHYCKTHDVLFDITPQNALRGCGCSLCKSDKLSSKKLKTQEKYVNELREKNIPVKLIGKYVRSLVPTEHLCLKHNVTWVTTPARVLDGKGCPQCLSEKIRSALIKQLDVYISELSLINPKIILVGDYNGHKVPTEHYCTEHDETFMSTPESVLKGRGCLHCSGSKGEKKVSEWLTAHNIQYISQKSFEDCKDVYPLPFDFYLPDYNTCIEYDGKQHYEPVEYFGGKDSLEYTQKHDAIKTEYCRTNNISLLRIPYFEDVYEQLNNFLFI